MNDAPERGRGTTGEGRPIGPARRNLRWDTGSVHGLSHPNRKWFSPDTRIRLVQACYSPKTAVKSGSSGVGTLLSGQSVEHDRGGAGDPTRGKHRAERDDPRSGREAPARDSVETVVRCALLSCAEPVEEAVDHPHRPEERTPMCSFHARRARKLRGISA